ncbi:hypothetical protein [Thermopetrobacter sp. TC1]|uniref:hypothetical protein n=1 Tax=Thermopetrobacter sp. TC1 TaxID=1495045 RepID=UPI00056FBF4E|nr:hypothetical protein [Thermopetrobacter sp. TC1]
MKRLLVLVGAAASLIALGLAQEAMADEKFIPKGFSYRPGDTRLPPLNSQRYRIITRADELEARIYTSKKLRSDFEDYIYRNQQRDLSPPRPGWRYY